MADTKISALTSNAALDGTEALPIVQGGANKKALLSSIATYINGLVSVAFSAITGKPTTLSGYGITDALAKASNLSDVSSASSARANLGLAIGTNVQAWDADLDALAALSGTNTLYYRSGAATWSAVTIGTNLTFSAGTLSASGGGSGNAWKIEKGPLDNEAPSSSFATLDTRNGHPTLDFDDTSAENAVFTAIMPNDYSGAGLTVYIYWAATSATTGNVMWQVAFEACAAGGQDTDSDGFATAQAFAASAADGTSGKLTKVSLNVSNGANMDSIAAGDLFRFKITRDASNASDTMTGDAELMRVMVVSQ